MRLLMIRHGQTPSNVRGELDTGLPGPGLTELGVHQAAAVPRALSGERIVALYASSMLRARLTTAPLAAALDLPVLVRDGLREIAAGDLEMRNDPASIDLYHEVSFDWASGNLERRMPGGESGIEAFGRFDAVVGEFAAAGHETVACVAHGQIIRSWVAARADNVDVEFASHQALHNTGVITLEGSPEDGWDALSWTGVAIGDRALGDRALDDRALDEGCDTGPGGAPA